MDATEGVVEARGAVAEAEDKVTEALVAQAIAQEELDTALGNNQTVLDDQIAKLLELAGQMEPGSPVRARLMEMAEQLNGLTSRPWTIQLQTAICRPSMRSQGRRSPVRTGPASHGRARDGRQHRRRPEAGCR
ncbi:MAG: hypothetical protein IPH48_17445 [bacterium]|nr:hypothetical protein [bacterium]